MMQGVRRFLSSHGRLAIVLALCFIGYSLLLVARLGPLGFLHDEWRILELAYHQSLPGVFKSAMYDAKRPLQSVAWILTYKAVGFQDLVFNALSGLERALSVLLAVATVAVAWPGRKRFSLVLAMLLFFFPPFTLLFYDFSADGVWQGLILFWAAVLCWQVGAAFIRIRWLAAGVAGVLFGISLLNYEIALLWPPVAAVLAAMVFARQQPTRRQWLSAGTVWSLSVLVGYALYWIVRERYDLNAHSRLSDFPTLLQGIDSLRTMIRFAGPPPTLQAAQPLDVLIACVTGVVVWVILGQAKDQSETASAERAWPWIIGGLGILAYVMGLFPYLITGYTPDIGYDRAARIYGSAVFGFLLIVAMALVKFVRAWPWVRLGVSLWVMMMALFSLTSLYDLQQAAHLRQQFMMDLIEQAPQLKPDTHVIWVDTDIRVGDAPVMGWGLRFITIFYDPSIAWISLPLTAPAPMIVSAQGVPAAEKPSQPLDSLVIFQREGDHLVLVDCLRKGDQVAIDWQDGITEICTNKERILPDPEHTNLTRLQALGLLPVTPPFGSIPQ